MHSKQTSSSKQAFDESNKSFLGNIVLIGMPGSGKSTLAKELANYLNWAIIDTDHLLQAWFGITVQGLIDQFGTKKFIKAEEQIILDLILQRCIIATGGSVIYSIDAMKKLQGIGTIIYLHADYHIIENRVSKNPERGLAMPQGQTLEDLYRERVPMYRKFAHLEISTQTENLNQCMHTILEGLNAQEEIPELKKNLTRESK